MNKITCRSNPVHTAYVSVQRLLHRGWINTPWHVISVYIVMFVKISKVRDAKKKAEKTYLDRETLSPSSPHPTINHQTPCEVAHPVW